MSLVPVRGEEKRVLPLAGEGGLCARSKGKQAEEGGRRTQRATIVDLTLLVADDRALS